MEEPPLQLKHPAVSSGVLDDSDKQVTGYIPTGTLFQAEHGFEVQREGDRCGRVLHEPADKAIVICVDEKSRIQALDRSRTILPLRLGKRPSRFDAVPIPIDIEPLPARILGGCETSGSGFR